MNTKKIVAHLLAGTAIIGGNAMAQNVYDATLWYEGARYTTFPSFSAGSTVSATDYTFLQMSGNDNQITISFSDNGIFTGGSFNGYHIDFEGGSFTGVSLDSSTMIGFVAGDIALVSGEIQVNVQSLDIIAGQNIVLDVNGSTTPVPEPTTLGLAGLGCLTLLIRRRK